MQALAAKRLESSRGSYSSNRSSMSDMSVALSAEAPELVKAAEKGDASAVRRLIEAGSGSRREKLEEKDDRSGHTALRAAASRGHAECVEALLRFGAAKEGKSRDGHTALRLAAAKGHVACVELLLKAGADKEARDKEGRTAVMVAAWKGHATCVRALIDAGAARNVKTRKGSTVLELAQQGGRTKVVDLLRGLDARDEPLSELHRRMFQVADELDGQLANLREQQRKTAGSKFECRQLVFGLPQEAALGVEHYMCVAANELRAGLNLGLDGMKDEVTRNGNDVDRECLDYVLFAAAGSSDATFQGGLRRDCDEQGNLLPYRRREDGLGMKLDDFVRHPMAVAAGLTKPHVAALRFYTTAAYRTINEPLRDQQRYTRGESHPLPITVALIREALGKLRVNAANSDRANTMVELFRGMRDVQVQSGFLEGGRGGTELAPMSTTSSLKVAMQYASSENSVLLRLLTKNFMCRGPEISFLSAFPMESEYLYPPLTYLQPTGDEQKLRVDDAVFTVIDVEPTFP